MKIYIIFAVLAVSALEFRPVDSGLIDIVTGISGKIVDSLAKFNLNSRLKGHLEKFNLTEKFANATDELKAKWQKNFLKNDEMINRTNLENIANNILYYLVHNEFSTQDQAEFNAARLGTSAPGDRNPNLGSAAPSRKRRATTATPPARVDWRGTGALTPVKNQGQCGSCWSFSANGALVGAWYVKYKVTLNFSEQNLVDCDTADSGCNGGWMTNAYDYVKSNGINTDAAYPYETAQKTCRYKAAGKVANVTSWDYTDPVGGDENALALAVARQPIATAIDATKLQLYGKGFYTCTGNVTLNHGVLIVGYDIINGTNAWILKNSWGASWGYNGFFYIPRNANNACGIASAANYPIV